MSGQNSPIHFHKSKLWLCEARCQISSLTFLAWFTLMKNILIIVHRHYVIFRSSLHKCGTQDPPIIHEIYIFEYELA